MLDVYPTQHITVKVTEGAVMQEFLIRCEIRNLQR